MKHQKKAVTLVELLVWITISMILMASVGVFLSSWLKNIFVQEKSIENLFSINDFFDKLNTSIKNIKNKNEIEIKKSSDFDSIIFRKKQDYNNDWFTYIWTTKYDFCKTGQKNENIIFIKNFIPRKNQTLETKNFLINPEENKVFKKDWTVLIWKYFYWKEKEAEKNNLKEIILNNPTSLAEDENGNLFIVDSSNNRILLYEKESEKIYNFLSEETLDLPTEIKFDWKNLKIVNTWKKEILEYKDKTPKIDFQKNLNIVWEKEYEIKISKIPQKEYWLFDEKEADSLFLDKNKIKNIFETNFKLEFWDSPEKENWKISQYFKIKRKIPKVEKQKKEAWKSEKEEELKPIKLNVNLVDFLDLQKEKNSNSKYYFYFDEKENWELFFDNSEKKLEKTQAWNFFYSVDWDFLDLKNPWNFAVFNELNDFFLENPISSLKIDKNGDFLNLIIKYYRNFDCQNLDLNEKKIKTLFIKIFLN